MNRMQAYLTKKENSKIILDIVKLFHPELESIDTDKIKVLTRYEWIMIDSIKYKIHIGIQFNINNIMSGDKPLSVFEKAYKENKFVAWRFCDDKKYKCYAESEKDPDYNIDIHDFMNKNQVPKPTPKEMYNYYHSD